MFRSRFLVYFNDWYARMIWGNKPEEEINKKLTSMDIITILIYIWFPMLLGLKMDDRAYWMHKVSRVEPLYLDKVEVFLEAAQKDAWNKQLAEINYPCRDCNYFMLFPLAQLRTVR